MKQASVLAAVFCGAWCAATAHAEFAVISVSMTDLGTLGGQSSEANDINDAGTIVGNSTDSLGAFRAFYYSGGAMYQVGVSGAEANWASGINNSGHIVGTWRDPSGNHAFRWQGGFISPLAEGPPLYSTVESSAIAIADNGRIAGQLTYPHPLLLGITAANLWLNSSNHFHLYPSAILQDFSSSVQDIDELGRAVVWDYAGSQSYLVNHFGPPAATYKAVPAPPSLPGHVFSYIGASGLHESNGVVGGAGYYSPNDVPITRAYYWNTVSPTVTLLPMLNGAFRSSADDINSQKIIAGWSDVSPVAPPRVMSDTGFIYHDDFGIYALPRGHFSNCRARALNERNRNGDVDVVGWCQGAQGKRAIRWKVRIKGSPGPHT